MLRVAHHVGYIIAQILLLDVEVDFGDIVLVLDLEDDAFGGDSELIFHSL